MRGEAWFYVRRGERRGESALWIRCWDGICLYMQAHDEAFWSIQDMCRAVGARWRFWRL